MKDTAFRPTIFGMCGSGSGGRGAGGRSSKAGWDGRDATGNLQRHGREVRRIEQVIAGCSGVLLTTGNLQGRMFERREDQLEQSPEHNRYYW